MKERKEKRYPIINARNITIISLITILLTSILVFVLGKKSFLIEVEITLLIISVTLFSFLSVSLYRGVRLKNQSIVEGDWKYIKPTDYLDSISYAPDVIPDFDFDFGEGIVGVILGIIAWIVLTIVILTLLFIFANLLWGLIFILAVIIYWIFYRALRLVFIKSRICKGKLLVSIGYGFIYSLLYTGWIYGAIEIFKRINR